jgi:hypothetical protein
VNAWPFEDRGYNDLPDETARARVFDAALERMAEMQPDRILIACNTLSILYPRTAFSRRPSVPVHGISMPGDLFAGAPGDPLVSPLLGQDDDRISEHRAAQARRDPAGRRGLRHGLAGAIERDVDGPRTRNSSEHGAGRRGRSPGGTLFLGLCCTHYGYVAARLIEPVARQTSRHVLALDPNRPLASSLLGDAGFFEDTGDAVAAAVAPGASARGVSVELVSKVILSETARAGIARLVAPISRPPPAPCYPMRTSPTRSGWLRVRETRTASPLELSMRVLLLTGREATPRAGAT